MSVDRKEIDLIIRAALQNGKTLDGVTKSITDIEKALESQSAAAKRGETSIDELKATLLALKQVQDQLKDQAGLIGQFQRLGTQIASTADKTDKAKKEFEAYQGKLDKAGKATEFQSNKLLKLGTALDRNVETLARQKQEYETLGGALREAGVNLDNLAGAETQARQAAAQLGITISKTQTEITNYGDTVRKAREEQRRLAEERSFEKQLQDAAKLAQASSYVRMWQDALAAADQAEEQNRINTSLRKAADEAIAAARGYKTLGTAVKSLSGTSGGIRSVVDGILEPAKAAVKSLSGIEQQIGDVAKAVGKATGPISDYSEQVNKLVAANRSLTEKANLIDSFSRQTAALRDARGEFTQARTQVLQYAEALRNSGGQNDQLQASLQRAQAALAAAHKRLVEQLTATRTLRDSMREAGLSTADLAATQQRLVEAAKRSTDAMNGLVEAKRKYGNAAGAAASSMNLFSDSGRTTLSMMQRLRGEVLSLAAAYGGIYGAISGAQASLEAFNAKQGIQNQLALSAGNDNAKIAAEYEYIRQQADRIGLSFESAAKGYAKFSAAATLAGRDSQEIKYIFESFAEVGRVANLTADNMDGVFKALEQIISKGTIQAEELRGQLGDRLFGAFQVAAEALKEQFPSLDKAMKEGKVTSEQLVLIAEKYKEIVGVRLADATNNLTANQARLNTSLFEFKTLVAEGGFADEYSKLLRSLSEFLASDDGKKFASDLADGLGGIARALRWVVENAETVKTVLISAVFIFGAKHALGLGVAIATLPAKIAAMGAAFATAGAAVKSLHAIFGVFTAAVVGWNIGKVLNEQVPGVTRWAQTLIGIFDYVITWTKGKFSELPNFFTKLLYEMMSGVTGFFKWVAEKFGSDEFAALYGKMETDFKQRADGIKQSSASMRSQLEKDLGAIRSLVKDSWNDKGTGASALPRVTARAGATDKPTDIKPGRSTANDDEKAAEKRIRLKEQIENELTSIEAKIERNEKESLSRRLAAIDLTYQKLLGKIRTLGGPDGARLESELTKNVNELKLQEIRKFNDTLLAEQTAIQRKLEQVEAAAGRKEKTDLQARLDAVKSQYEVHYREIEELRQTLILNNRDTSVVDAMKVRLDTGVASLQGLEQQKYYEDSINAILEQRKAKLDTIAVQEKVGLITSLQAREQAAAVITKTQPKIEALVAEGLAYADAMITAAEAAGSNTVALETLKAKLIEAKGSATRLHTELFSAAQINEMLGSGMTNAFTTATTAIGEAVAGVRSWGDAIRSARNAFLSFAADFLKQIATMILKQMILNALSSSSGGAGGAIAGALNGSVKHIGGLVDGSGPQRRVSPMLFAGAPRYHGGGIAGLAPGEYPAILKKNEEVLTESDPRHVFNAGQSQPQQAQPTNLKVINMIDTASVVSEGLSSQGGEKALINVIRANRTSIKSILG